MSSAWKKYAKIWYEPAAIPIYVVIGGALTGCAWYLTRLARGPDVVWDHRNNPQPYLDIKPNETIKMLQINQGLEKKWTRDKF